MDCFGGELRLKCECYLTPCSLSLPILFAGRVHSAMVAKVNPECRSVTVEWSERGETKGKEIELAAIMQLNGELFNAAPEPEPKKQATGASNLVRVSDHR